MSKTKLKAKQRSALHIEQELCEQLKCGKYCDATFRIGEEKVIAHRCVLAAASKYFDTMFTSDFRDKNEAEINLTDTFGCADALRCLVEFIYGNEIVINEENVEELLRGSDLFGIDTVIEFCMRFFLQNLCIQNCLWTWSLASTYNLPEVADTCRDLAICRFHDTIIGLEETLQLPPQHLMRFLKEGLSQHCKHDQFQSFLERYIAHDVEARQTHRTSILKEAGLLQQETNTESEASEDKPEEQKPESIKEPKETGARPKEKRDLPQDTEEAVLVQMVDAGTWALYSTSRDQWFTGSGNSRNIAVEDIAGPIGIGPERNHMFIERKQANNQISFRLVNTVTSEIKYIPDVPGTSSSPGITDRQILVACPESISGTLYCVVLAKTSTQQTNKPSEKEKTANQGDWQRNLRGMYESRNFETFFECYIIRFDMEENEWKRTCTIKKFKEQVPLLKRILSSTNSLYILMIRPGEAAVSVYRAVDDKVYQKSSYTKTLELAGHNQLKVVGDKNGFIILDRSKSVTYTYDTDKWSVQEEMNTLPKVQAQPGELKGSPPSGQSRHILLALSHTQRKSYFITRGFAGIQRLTRFKAFDVVDESISELSPYPCITTTRYRAVIVRVSEKMLSNLELCTLNDSVKEKVCLAQEIEGRVAEYLRRRDKIPTSAKSSEEHRRRLQEAETARQQNLLRMPLPYRPWMPPPGSLEAQQMEQAVAQGLAQGLVGIPGYSPAWPFGQP